MQHRKPVTIGEVAYEIEHLAPTVAIPLMTKMMKLLGVGIGAGSQKLDQDFDKALPGMIGEMLARTDEAEVMVIIKGLVSSVYKGIEKVNLDLEFRGRLGDLSELLIEAAKWQYGDFFQKLGAKFTTAMQTMLAKRKTLASSTEGTSPGSSGIQ